MIGEGVHNIYKERARAGGDVLWHVTIKGQSELTEDIPLHMSLKVFSDKNDMDIEDLKRKIYKFDVKKPDPKKLEFKTTIFTSEKDAKKYYMLLVNGTDKAYESFYDSLRNCGTTYNSFMMHITIDKGLYDKINEEGLKPEEVVFSNLTIERGAGNTVYEFKKSLDINAIRETFLLDIELTHKHSIDINLNDDTLRNYVNDRPDLNDKIIQKHDERIDFYSLRKK